MTTLPPIRWPVMSWPNLAGDVLRQETTLPLARAWMERLVELDRIAQPELAPQVRAGPLCR